MVDNIIIAVDDSPEEAYRLFFETCADSIREKAVEVGVEHHRIGSTNLNAEYINETIQRINNTFAFSALFGSPCRKYSSKLSIVGFFKFKFHNFILQGLAIVHKLFYFGLVQKIVFVFKNFSYGFHKG